MRKRLVPPDSSVLMKWSILNEGGDSVGWNSCYGDIRGTSL